jgi:hypothetical protein
MMTGITMAHSDPVKLPELEYGNKRKSGLREEMFG